MKKKIIMKRGDSQVEYFLKLCRVLLKEKLIIADDEQQILIQKLIIEIGVILRLLNPKK